MMEFSPFPKVPRYSREIVVTEKIDGTNAGIQIVQHGYSDSPPNGYTALVVEKGLYYALYAQSRKRIITPASDNYGFAAWVAENAPELVRLDHGVHFGEWWGHGIQRGYGMPQGVRKFSLFNTSRWSDNALRPACCDVVPVLYQGDHLQEWINGSMTILQAQGSRAAPGFMNPEGIMIYHTASGQLFKKTYEGDERGKEAA